VSIDDDSRPRPWNEYPVTRLSASVLSWFLFAFFFGMLVFSMLAVLAVGGSCATGGPYEIAVECPDGAALAPVGIIGGLIAVGLGAFISQGFGTQLVDLAWPVLFCGLGGIFIAGFFATGDPTGLLVGGVFEVMGVLPLILVLRYSAQRVLIGAVNVAGRRFIEPGSDRRQVLGLRLPPVATDTRVRATAGNWALSLSITIVSAGIGIALARTLFGT
jgi:hypothetical protein